MTQQPPPEGGPPPQLTPEQLREIQLQQRQIAATNMVPVLMAFGPPDLTERKAFEVAMAVQGQQGELGQVVDDGVDAQKRQSHPYWGMRFVTEKGEGGAIHVPKNPMMASSLAQLKQHTEILAYITSPMARALAFIHGVRIEFFQSSKPPGGSILLQ